MSECRFGARRSSWFGPLPWIKWKWKRDGVQRFDFDFGGKGPTHLAKGRHEVSASFDVVLLPRDYTIDLGVHHHDGQTSDYVQRCRDFSVLRVAEDGGDHYRWARTRGLVRVSGTWTGLESDD